METTLMELCLNYGTLGIFSAILIWDKYNHQKHLTQVIKNNTNALIRVKQLLNYYIKK